MLVTGGMLHPKAASMVDTVTFILAFDLDPPRSYLPLPQTHATKEPIQVLFDFKASSSIESLLSDRLYEVKRA